ncbi:MAG: carbonic anhydrase family protein [Ignavibacteria bacterium]
MSEKSKDATVIQTKETQAKITPSDALKMLKEGNERFVKSVQLHRDLMKQAKETSKGQYPYAVILSCLDSRTSAEIIFDQGIGDVFSARVAGNIINDDIIGSLEFACKVTGSKLIVVLGHTDCGAVKSACDQVKLGNITTLLEKLDTAVSSAKSDGERNSKNKKFVQDVADLNVKLGIQQIKDKSSILNEMINKGEIMIVGGMYNIETGKAEFFTE